ncbi:hypothetical protein HYW43_02455 [Candidatus Daviesbacteria bacterium]|nr:hypothetical protein [Candidatus Daviesbacteria bacterium]
MKLYSNINIIFTVWLASLLLISYLGFSTLPHSGKFSNDFLSSFSNWDGGHFLAIAQKGYQENFQYAFFPFYPMVIKTLTQFTNNFLLSGVLISLLSFYFGLQILYKLIILDFDKKIALKIIAALAFFPTSFYFLTAYSEGLFFLLVVLTFYFLRTNKLFLATIFAVLVSGTRLAGLAVVLALILEVQLTRGINKKNWFVLFSPLGFLAYVWFLYNQTSDPFYFLTAERYWQRELVVPIFGFWDTIKNVTTPNFLTSHFNPVLDLLFAIFGLGLAIRSFRFLPISYSVYAFVSIALPLFTPTLSSIPRFLLPIFPIFILLGLIKSQFLNLFYPVITLMLLSIFTVLFFNGFWVA